VMLPAAAASRFTIRLLARPLWQLRDGITSAGNGRLEPIEVSKSSDEVEFLGEGFNGMVATMATSQMALLEQQGLLDQRNQQLSRQLEEALRKAEASNLSKSEFVANISRELRTPMNRVVGTLDIALDGDLSPELAKQLQTAQGCAHSVLSLLNDILDLSKIEAGGIEAGKMTLEKLPFDVRALLADSIQAHQPKAAGTAVSLRLEVSPEVPRQLTGDLTRIRQIVANLVSNALKVTEHGSVVVRAGGQFTQPREFTLNITVEDSGAGIPAGELLGVVTLKCEADAGVPAEDQKPNLADSVPSTPGASGSAPRILVVEDNQVNQKVVTAVLRKRGFFIELANDGQEALNKLDNSAAFDLVLMDVQMPVLDGLEATRLIRKEPRWKELPIIAMTAHAMSGDKERCLEAGMNGYISKPVHPSLLLSTVDEFLLQKIG
jgi:CheY-like chemotaxis protein